MSAQDGSMLHDANPELTAFIYQQLSEFEAFLTPTTTVAVVAKNPLKLIPKLEEEGIEFNKKDLKKMHRISIVLSENGTKLEAEGLAESVYEAIIEAKKKLLTNLIEIQDKVISNQDRVIQIQTFRDGGNVH
jgi:ribosome-associated translation inhibitor RaiA